MAVAKSNKKRPRAVTAPATQPGSFELLAKVTTVLSTRGGTRTHTFLRTLDFESSASANSATLAFVACRNPILTELIRLTTTYNPT